MAGWYELSDPQGRVLGEVNWTGEGEPTNEWLAEETQKLESLLEGEPEPDIGGVPVMEPPLYDEEIADPDKPLLVGRRADDSNGWTPEGFGHEQSRRATVGLLVHPVESFVLRGLAADNDLRQGVDPQMATDLQQFKIPKRAAWITLDEIADLSGKGLLCQRTAGGRWRYVVESVVPRQGGKAFASAAMKGMQPVAIDPASALGQGGGQQSGGQRS